MAFESAILHACAKQKMTNDSTVAAIQLVVASKRGKKNEAAHEWEARLSYDICLGRLSFALTGEIF